IDMRVASAYAKVHSRKIHALVAATPPAAIQTPDDTACLTSARISTFARRISERTISWRFRRMPRSTSSLARRLIARQGPTEEESERRGYRERGSRIAFHERLDVRHHPLGVMSAHVLRAAAEPVGRRPRNIADGLATGQVLSSVMKR